MKRMFRRLLALCLTLILAAAILPVGAQAMTQATTGTIQISGVEDGAAVTVYRLMDVHYDDTADQPVQPVYTWISAVADWVQTNYPVYINISDNSVTDGFYTLTSDSTGYGSAIASFYDQLAKAIRSGDISVASAGSRTGNGDIEGLTMGNYLVLIENGMKIYRPSTVNLIPVWNNTSEAWEMSSAAVVVKASEPTISKSLAIAGAAAGDNNVQVGSTVNYTLSAIVPVYPDNALATDYCIGDDLPAGLTLDASSVKAYGVKDGEEDVLLTAGDYTLTASSTTLPNSRAVDLKLVFVYSRIRGYDSIRVEYSAAVNENVVLGTTGNTNTAYLVYSNNPYATSANASWKEKSASASVYSFGIEVTKVAKTTGTALTGAQFTIASANDADTALTFLKKSTGKYYLSSGTGSSAMLEVDADGKLDLHGLLPGTYYLTETKAPGGYVKLQPP